MHSKVKKRKNVALARNDVPFLAYHATPPVANIIGVACNLYFFCVHINILTFCMPCNFQLGYRNLLR